MIGSIAGASSPRQEIIVKIEGMQFNPKVVTAGKGQKIKWINQDLVPHTVTSNGAFDSKTIPPGESWILKLKKTGHFDYKCQFHPTMNGAIDVP
jgi:plastocyanin